jgi:hypothetical protein
MEKLKKNIVELINAKSIYESAATPDGNRVLIKIRDNDYDQHMGSLLKEIQQLIDQYCPERTDDFYLIVQDQDRIRENAFKIWKTV